MLAYLTMMANRLIELHRVLKPTGSLYLHCDPTASHYLKIVLDSVFGPACFRNEITWKRSSAHNDTKQGMRRYGKVRDILFFYAKGPEHTWNQQYSPYTAEYLRSEYKHVTPDGRYYKETDLTGAKPGGDTSYEWHVKRPVGQGEDWRADIEDEYREPRPGWEYRAVRPYDRRFWAYSKDNVIDFARSGKLIHRETGMPRLMHFADEMPGVSLQDLWTDIPPATGGEDLGYPTQKPLALLERVIGSSSSPGDIVLDPFCGCGTAVHAAEKLGRGWIGIDITHLAVSLIERRMKDAFPGIAFEVHGTPRDHAGARNLAERDKYQFQFWALSLVNAQPYKSGKKGADGGTDGLIYFQDDKGAAKKIIVSVKGGESVTRTMIADLKNTVEREKAAIGLFVTLVPPTQPMMTEAATAGFYESPQHGKFQKIQILTIEGLLSGHEQPRYPDLAQGAHTFRKAKREGDAGNQGQLFGP